MHEQETEMRTMQGWIQAGEKLAEILLPHMPESRSSAQTERKSEGIQMNISPDHAYWEAIDMKAATDDFWIEAIAGARRDLEASREWHASCVESLRKAEERVRTDEARYSKLQREHGRA